MSNAKDQLQSIVWDLGSLYQGLNDPAIERDQNWLKEQIESFETLYRKQIHSPDLTAETLAKAMAQYEAISACAHDLLMYAMLRWNVAMGDRELTSFKDQVSQFLTEMQTRLEFFRLALIAIDDTHLQSLLTHPDVHKYQQFFDTIRRFKPYALSEQEERILTLEQQFSRQRWVDFYIGTTSHWSFAIRQADGTVIDMTEDEAMDQTRRPDRELREAGFRGLFGKYGQKTEFSGYIYNTLVQEHANEARLRGFDSTLSMQAIQQHLDAETVQLLLQQIREHNQYFQRYYQKLANILEIDKIRTSDMNAPCSQVEKTVSFNEARTLILEAVGHLDGELADRTREFFDKSWIHGDVYKGKASGAFCAPTSQAHPYVLVNWNQNLYSLTALAHELGHGLHFYETTRHQHILHMMPPLYLAETASTFNEYLLADYMLEKEEDHLVQRHLLSDLLQRFLNGLYRQSLISDFELFAHSEGWNRTLGQEELSEKWMELTQKRDGNAIETMSEERFGWSRVQHIFLHPFYCYNYTLSNLVVLSIIYQYQKDRKEFVNRYRQFLQAGGGRSAHELLGILNLDLKDENFYAHAFQVLDGMLTRFEGL